jgi:hypothetical protein
MVPGIILIEFRPALPFGCSAELTWKEVTAPDFAEAPDLMSRFGVRIESVPAPALSSCLSGNIPAHSADCACFALNNLAATAGGLAAGLAAAGGPLASPAPDPLASPIGKRCQPTPGWKQSTGDDSAVTFRTGELLPLPALPILPTTPGGLLDPACGLASGAAASNTKRLMKSRLLLSIIWSYRRLSL